MQSWMVCSKMYGFATWMKDGWMGGGGGSAHSGDRLAVSLALSGVMLDGEEEEEEEDVELRIEDRRYTLSAHVTVFRGITTCAYF
jgi:hypothetical protein